MRVASVEVVNSSLDPTQCNSRVNSPSISLYISRFLDSIFFLFLWLFRCVSLLIHYFTFSLPKDTTTLRYKNTVWSCQSKSHPTLRSRRCDPLRSHPEYPAQTRSRSPYWMRKSSPDQQWFVHILSRVSTLKSYLEQHQGRQSFNFKFLNKKRRFGCI